jgi:hypothetical protein
MICSILGGITGHQFDHKLSLCYYTTSSTVLEIVWISSGALEYATNDTVLPLKVKRTCIGRRWISMFDATVGVRCLASSIVMDTSMLCR